MKKLKSCQLIAASFEVEEHIESRSVNNIMPPPMDTYLRQCPRRGSAPAVSPANLAVPMAVERSVLTRHTSLNGKANRRKKQLRRRSSGGPETVCSQEVISQESWHRYRRELARRNENPDTLLARRRGSLPIEMLTVGHSGKRLYSINYHYFQIKKYNFN